LRTGSKVREAKPANTPAAQAKWRSQNYVLDGR
jgi:hypothetical protein